MAKDFLLLLPMRFLSLLLLFFVAQAGSAQSRAGNPFDLSFRLPDSVLVADAASLAAVREQWTAAHLFAAGAASTRVLGVDGERLHRPTLRTFAAVQSLCEAIDRVRQTLH